MPNVHDIILVLQHCCLVIVHIQIVRRRKDCHDTWEPGRLGLSVHPVPSVLRLMCTNDGKQVIFLKERAGGRIREKVRTSTDIIVDEEIRSFFLTKFFERIRPEDVAHQPVGWGFAETVDTSEVVKSLQLRAQTAVDTQELFIHDGGQGKGAETVHTSFVHTLGVFVFA